MNRLTRQEQYVICIACALLLVGWAVKTYRTANPVAAIQTGVDSPANERVKN